MANSQILDWVVISCSGRKVSNIWSRVICCVFCLCGWNKKNNFGGYVRCKIISCRYCPGVSKKNLWGRVWSQSSNSQFCCCWVQNVTFSHWFGMLSVAELIAMLSVWEGCCKFSLFLVLESHFHVCAKKQPKWATQIVFLFTFLPKAVSRVRTCVLARLSVKTKPMKPQKDKEKRRMEHQDKR